MADRLMTAQAQAQSGPSPELMALQDGLRTVRDSASASDRRNQETLEAVHETLEQIVTKLAELETVAVGQQVAAAIAQPGQSQPVWHSQPAPVAEPQIFAEPEPETQAPQILAAEPNPFAPAIEQFAQEPANPFAPSPAEAVSPAEPPFAPEQAAAPADDFIAAARKMSPAEIRAHPEYMRLAELAKQHVRGTRVTRLGIHDRDGRTIFSTSPVAVGSYPVDPAAFESARAEVETGASLPALSSLTTDGASPERMIFRSFVSVRGSDGGPLVISLFSDTAGYHLIIRRNLLISIGAVGGQRR
ncbi:MAG: hypothetical protein HC855_15115, partial [Rhizobiales bacterium]|nr:hypothetical protein [Hyphomicrobiales bacterium]